MIWQRQLLTYEDSLEQIRSIRAGFVLVSEFEMIRALASNSKK